LVIKTLLDPVRNRNSYPDPDSLEMLDPGPFLDSDAMNPDPQHRSIVHLLIYLILSLLYCDRQAICVSGPL
jgi:hypothetical protein